MKQFETIDQSFKISYNYKLHFTENLFGFDNPLLAEILRSDVHPGKKRVLFVIDQGVFDHHSYLTDEIGAYCKKNNDIIHHTGCLFIPGGERCKNEPEHLESVLKAIEKKRICRHSFVVAIGGGAVIDLTGYAAATAHRGVRLIRVPTTVLSQNDAAVGVKNSVNAFNKKNFLGTFAPPFAVINDWNFLNSLDHRDWISGVAEAVKVALIKDRSFFEQIEKKADALYNRDMESMQQIIYRCAQLHMQHIAGGDPFESGSSRPLDFGHWAAHKLEYLSGYKLRHGEAVAIGMAVDITYSHLIGLIDQSTMNSILNVLERIGFDLHIPLHPDEFEKLIVGIDEFREHLGGKLTITLIDGIGSKKDVHKIDLDLMKKAIAGVHLLHKLKLTN